MGLYCGAGVGQGVRLSVRLRVHFVFIRTKLHSLRCLFTALTFTGEPTRARWKIKIAINEPRKRFIAPNAIAARHIRPLPIYLVEYYYTILLLNYPYFHIIIIIIIISIVNLPVKRSRTIHTIYCVPRRFCNTRKPFLKIPRRHAAETLFVEKQRNRVFFFPPGKQCL